MVWSHWNIHCIKLCNIHTLYTNSLPLYTLYYHVTVSVCVVVTISVYGVLAKRYKLRTRNDPVNIPHIVATVYERYIEQSKQHKQFHGGSETLIYESVED